MDGGDCPPGPLNMLVEYLVDTAVVPTWPRLLPSPKEEEDEEFSRSVAPVDSDVFELPAVVPTPALQTRATGGAGAARIRCRRDSGADGAGVIRHVT